MKNHVRQSNIVALQMQVHEFTYRLMVGDE
jgi:hypothetical protein